MTDDLARETARRVLDAAMNHGDAEAAVQIISEALAAERERCVARLKQMQDAAHQLSDYGEESTLDRAIAAIREEPQP